MTLVGARIVNLGLGVDKALKQIDWNKTQHSCKISGPKTVVHMKKKILSSLKSFAVDEFEHPCLR